MADPLRVVKIQDGWMEKLQSLTVFSKTSVVRQFQDYLPNKVSGVAILIKFLVKIYCLPLQRQRKNWLVINDTLGYNTKG